MAPSCAHNVRVPVAAIIAFLYIALWAAVRLGSDGATGRRDWPIWRIWLLGPATVLVLMCCLLLARLLLSSVC